MDRGPLWKNCYQVTFHGVMKFFFLETWHFHWSVYSRSEKGSGLDIGQVCEFLLRYPLQPLDYSFLISFHFTAWAVFKGCPFIMTFRLLCSINHLQVSLQVSSPWLLLWPFYLLWQLCPPCFFQLSGFFSVDSVTWVLLFGDTLMSIFIREPSFLAGSLIALDNQRRLSLSFLLMLVPLLLTCYLTLW